MSVRLLFMIAAVMVLIIIIREQYLSDKEKNQEKIKKKNIIPAMENDINFKKLVLVESFDIENNSLDKRFFETINTVVKNKIDKDFKGILYELDFSFYQNEFYLNVIFKDDYTNPRTLAYIRLVTDKVEYGDYLGLAQIYISPHFRRCKVGEIMLFYFAQKAIIKGFSGMFLEAGVSNVPAKSYMDDILGYVDKNNSKENALKFYEKLGFQKMAMEEWDIRIFMEIEMNELIEKINEDLFLKGIL